MPEAALVWGKNRHFFGGIEPSNMINFTVSLNEANKPAISYTLPEDTIIDTQTLCTVVGAVICRKTTDYPANEFDGDRVAIVTSKSGTLVDEDALPNGTYFYAAFPFTTQDVYNRNPKNRAVVNEPAPMETFVAKSKYNGDTQELSVEITANLPEGIAGATIRKSTVDYPENEEAGELVKTITQSEIIVDKNVSEGTVYYYRAFPYTSTGAYNRATSPNQTSVTAKKFWLYGFDLNIGEQSPTKKITYPADVENADFTPAKMQFGGKFNYGSWTLKPGEKIMPKPCLLNYDGHVEYYLNPDNYTQKEDGQPSNINQTSVPGNFMMEWNKIYVSRKSEGGFYKVRFSDAKIDDSYECWSNYDKQNNEIDHFYTPIYFGSNDGGKMRSLSGKGGFVSQAADAEITAAKKNGAEDWFTEVYADWVLLKDLLFMIGKSTDTQTTFGFGRCKEQNSNAINSGSMDAKGMFWGSNDQTSGVKVFGMENPWGNIWRRIGGYILVNGEQKIKMTRGTKDGSSASDYNTSGSGYLFATKTKPSGTSGGFISTYLPTNYGLIPTVASGSSSTHLCDGLWYNNSGTMYAGVGGGWSNGLHVGASCVNLSDAPSNADTNVGASLSCKPSKK